MARDDARDWMWSEALNMLAQAERLHRQVFKPVPGPAGMCWEPPVDVIETKDAVLILAALPGVDPAQVHAVIEDGALVISGERSLPDEVKTAVIHRLELPQGRFERRLRLPPGRYSAVHRGAADGCLLITLTKTGISGG